VTSNVFLQKGMGIKVMLSRHVNVDDFITLSDSLAHLGNKLKK